MYKVGFWISSVLLCLASVSYAQTSNSLNCTNIPNVPIKPQDAEISAILSSANENIVVCDNIIPFLNPFIASLKLTGVQQQINQTCKLIDHITVRLEIINRRLDCGLVASVQEARSLNLMLGNDQVSNRVLNGVKTRLLVIKNRLQVIITPPVP
ncbi:uncharacterized protein LOC130629310 [Hydractinia symbiolongicarpus]|uniref:uncharacterized protein LOC130629310 n=1 Tax=Hydractinia symbiolongicarpus TaxID=13093 RepID=UPI00254D51B0|nr:uncharacterized protein LOC130629310 [Hydractinia symbiolongicarpus]